MKFPFPNIRKLRNAFKAAKEFKLPLAGTVQILSLFDVILGFLSLIVLLGVISLELLDSRRFHVHYTSKTTPPPSTNNEKDPFESALMDFEDGETDFEQDIETEAKAESKIAAFLSDSQSRIEHYCGDAYYEKFLHGEELEKTRNLFYETMAFFILSEVIYLAVAIVKSFSTICLILHRSAKLAVVWSWYVDLIPFFLYCHGLIRFMSYRFCIFEYGLPRFSSQKFTFIFIVIRVYIYKSIELWIASKYIRGLLVVGFLTDETEVVALPSPTDGKQKPKAPSVVSFNTKEKRRFKRLLTRRSTDSLLDLDPNEINDINNMSFKDLHLPDPNDYF